MVSYLHNNQTGLFLVVFSGTILLLHREGHMGWINHADLQCPYDLAGVGPDVFVVTSAGNHSVLCMDLQGKLKWSYGSKGNAAVGKLHRPVGK